MRYPNIHKITKRDITGVGKNTTKAIFAEFLKKEVYVVTDVLCQSNGRPLRFYKIVREPPKIGEWRLVTNYKKTKIAWFKFIELN